MILLQFYSSLPTSLTLVNTRDIPFTMDIQRPTTTADRLKSR